MDNSRGPVRSDVSQDSVTDPLVFFSFATDLPDALESLALLFVDGIKMVNQNAQKISLQRSHVTAWDWPEK